MKMEKGAIRQGSYTSKRKGKEIVKKERSTKEIWKNNWYGIRTAYSFSKSRVICAILRQITDYFLWVFYTAYFVRFVIETIQNQSPLEEILMNIGIIGGVSLLLNGFVHLCDTVIFPLADTKIYGRMYRRIYEKAENVELGCFENPEFYNQFSIALDGIGDKLGANVDYVAEIIGGTVGGVLACLAMIEIDPWTILFLIAPLAGNFIFAPKMNAINYRRYRDGVPYDRRISYVNRVMYLGKYAKEMRLYHIFNVIRRIFDDATKAKSNVYRKYYGKAMFYGILQYIFSYVIIFEGILLYGAYRALVAAGKPISFSQMAVLTTVMVTASWVWVRVIRAYNSCSENGLVVAELRSFLEYEEKIPENQDGRMPEPVVHSIEFRDVSFTYDHKHMIIDHMSFTIREGEKVALVGHNGAGKSTIIKLLLRLYDPTEGCILVNGVDIREYHLQEYRKLFLCAFQDYQIFAGTVKENVLMGREGTDEEVIQALRKAGIYEKIASLPNGIHTMLTREFTDDGAVLSGGEFQKIVCSRVFMDETRVALFDEPSSALDPISENELFNSIIHSVEGKTGIFISHRLSSVREADYVLMLEEGHIIEQGTHEELMRAEGTYAAMYKVQERNYFALDEEVAG